MRGNTYFIRLCPLLLLLAFAFAAEAQIDGTKGFMSKPSGRIKDVHEMENSPANLLKGDRVKLVKQFKKNEAENEDEEREETEKLYKQPNPMHATAKVKFLNPATDVSSPPALPAAQKLTAQHPAFTGNANEQGSLDPSDAQIAAGPNHLVVLANDDARILNKQTGAVISHVTLAAFFSLTGFVFDPRIFYDPYGQRFVVLALLNSNCNSDSKFRVLISNSSDPTQGWFYYDFDVDGSNVGWMDFAKLGFNKDWICIAGNVRCASVPGLYVIPRTAAYAAGSISYYYFNSIELATPAFTFDIGLDRLYLIRPGNSDSSGAGYVDSWYISSTPQLFTGSSYGTSPWQAFATDAAHCPHQLNGTNFTAVNTFGHGAFSNAVYRNGSLWFTHAVFLPATGTTTRCSTQWWQVNPATGVVQQVGRIDDASGAISEYYMSIGVNNLSDAVVTYSIFNATYHPSAAYNFRNAADAANQLPTGVFYTSGSTVDGDGRGGDYSQCAIDPLDDQSIWVVNQVPNGSWETRFALIPGYYGCYTDATFGNTNWSGNTKNEASNSITSAEMIQSPSQVDYDAGNFVDLVAGFWAHEGTWFKAYIDGCGGLSPARSKPQQLLPTVPFASVMPADGLGATLITPNTTKGIFNVQYKLNASADVSISVYGPDMKLVKQLNAPKQPPGLYTNGIDAGTWPAGLYTTKIQSGNDMKTMQILVEHK